MEQSFRPCRDLLVHILWGWRSRKLRSRRSLGDSLQIWLVGSELARVTYQLSKTVWAKLEWRCSSLSVENLINRWNGFSQVRNKCGRARPELRTSSAARRGYADLCLTRRALGIYRVRRQFCDRERWKSVPKGTICIAGAVDVVALRTVLECLALRSVCQREPGFGWPRE
jgi:hypothetical protein